MGQAEWHADWEKAVAEHGDADTFEEMAARSLDEQHESRPLDVDALFSQTLDGVLFYPTEAIASALSSRIRRVLIDARRVVIDLGEAGLFTGSSRHAGAPVQPQLRLGRLLRTRLAMRDRPHGGTPSGGRTHPGNGAPLCGKHNRWKQKGFSVQRNPDLTYTILRPDRSPVPPE